MERIEQAQRIKVVDARDVVVTFANENFSLLDNVAVDADSFVGSLMAEKASEDGFGMEVVAKGNLRREDDGPRLNTKMEIENRIFHDAMNGADVVLAQKIESEQLVPHFDIHKNIVHYHPNTRCFVSDNLLCELIMRARLALLAAIGGTCRDISLFAFSQVIEMRQSIG